MNDFKNVNITYMLKIGEKDKNGKITSGIHKR